MHTPSYMQGVNVPKLRAQINDIAVKALIAAEHSIVSKVRVIG